MAKLSQPRIAIVAHSKSGIAHYSYSLASALAGLAEQNRQNIFLLVNSGFSCKPVDKLEIIKLFSRTRRLPIELFKFFLLLLEKRFDVVHFQNPLKYLLVTWIFIHFSRLLGSRVVYTAHDVLPHYARGYHRILMKWIYKSADRIIAHSEENYHSIRKLAGNLNNIDIIPHGVYDIFTQGEEISKESAKEQLNIPASKKVLLFFGRIDERKGAEVIISALPDLLAQDPDVYLLMAGIVKLPLNRLQALTENSNAGDALRIIDKWIPDEDVKLYFSAADAIVLPYLEGSTSGVIKIALAFGKKVIATRVGELPGIIKKNNAGILVDFPLQDKDVKLVLEVLTNAPSALADDIDNETGSEYSWPVIAARTAELYQAELITR